MSPAVVPSVSIHFSESLHLIVMQARRSSRQFDDQLGTLLIREGRPKRALRV